MGNPIRPPEPKLTPIDEALAVAREQMSLYTRGGRFVEPSLAHELDRQKDALDEVFPGHRVGNAMHAMLEATEKQARELQEAPSTDRRSMLPATITANPGATPGGENIKLRPSKRDDSLILVIDKQRGYAQIEVTEPNVRELYDTLGRWLGEK